MLLILRHIDDEITQNQDQRVNETTLLTLIDNI